MEVATFYKILEKLVRISKKNKHKILYFLIQLVVQLSG